MGTPLDVQEQSPAGAAWERSFAHKVYKATFDGVESYDERESAFPRFRPVLVGPTLTNPPTGNTTGQTGVILNPFDPEDSQVRPPDYTTFLQPGRPLKEEIHGPEGPNWTTPGPISVMRTPSGKFRSEHGASTVARAEQEAAAGRRARQRQLNAMFEKDEAPLHLVPPSHSPSHSPASPATAAAATAAIAAIAPTQQPPTVPTVRLVPVQVPKAVPTPKQFAQQLGSLMRNEYSSQQAREFVVENALNITIAVLALVVLILLIVVLVVALRKSKVKVAAAAATVPYVGAFGGRLSTLRAA